MDSIYVIAYLVLGVNLVYRLLLRAYQGWRLHFWLLFQYAILGAYYAFLVWSRRGFGGPHFALSVILFLLLIPVPHFLKEASGAFALHGLYGPARFFALLSFLLAWSRENLFLYQFLTVLALRERAGSVEGGDDEARVYFQRILLSLPSPELRSAALSHLVSIDGAARRWDRAARLHRELSSLVGDRPPPDLLLQLVRAHAEVGDFAEAFDCQRSLEERKGSPEQTALGRIYLAALAGEPESVRRFFADQAHLVREWPPCLSSYWIGRAQLAAGDLPAARILLTNALEEAPSDEPAWRDAILEQLRVASLPGPPRSSASLDRVREGIRGLVSTPLPAPIRGGTTALFARKRRMQPVTAGLLLATILGFLLEEGTGGSTDPYTLMRCGAIYPDLVHPVGEYWRLVSHMFVHMHWLHILMNAYFLHVFGNLLESFYGRAKFLVIYLLSGVGGAVSSVGLRLLFADSSGTVAWVRNILGLSEIQGAMGGASGAVMGLLGCAIVFAIRHKRQLPAGARNFLIFNFVVIFVLIVGSGFAFDLIAPGGIQIDNWAHLGGGVAGMALAAFLTPDRYVERSTRIRRVLLGALVGTTLGIAGWAAVEVARNAAGRGYPRREVPLARVSSQRYISVGYPAFWKPIGRSGGQSLVDAAEPWAIPGRAILWVKIPEMQEREQRFEDYRENYMEGERGSIRSAGRTLGSHRPRDWGRLVEAGGRHFYLHALAFSGDYGGFEEAMVRHYYFHLTDEGSPIVFMFEFREDLEEDYEVLARRILASVRRLGE